MIENVEVIGHRPFCTLHKVFELGEYFEKYDSYYCKLCNRWLESKCVCGMFPNRPNKPNINNDTSIL